MSLEETIHLATEHGNNIGQTALAEFILKSYGDELSPKLRVFLQKVCDSGYNGIAATIGKPAEDIALEVGAIINNRMT